MYKIEVGTLTFTSDGTNITCDTQDGRSDTISLSSEFVEVVGDRTSMVFRGAGVVVSVNSDEWAYLKDGTALPQAEIVEEAPVAEEAEATPVVATTRRGRRRA